MKPAAAAALQAALLHEAQNHPAEARAAYEKVLRRDPRQADALLRLALIEEGGNPDRAAQLYRRAIAARPGFTDAIINFGILLQQQGRAADALEQFNRALGVNGRDLVALSNRGAALLILRRPAEALADFDRVLAANSRAADAASNRGAALLQLQRPQEALASFDQVVAARPDSAEAHTNRGLAFYNLRRPDEALSCFEHALRLRPDYNKALVAAGECQLLTGNLPPGWRNQLRSTRHVPPAPAVPHWTGAEPVAGRTVLLHTQQGLGDTLQFCRYAAPVAALGATVVLQVQATLLPLMATLAGPAQVVPVGAPLPPFDLQCALPALPAAFNTTLDSVPVGAPYLALDAGRVRHWSGRLGPRGRRRVGLAWSGNPDHLNDRNRSIPFADLAPLLGADADFISLQREVRDGDAAALAASGVRHFGDALADFGDTAALAGLMDVVVSVDTSVAHLAGALGRPTWLMLPWVAEWRWMLDRADSPWYPTMRLFRQPGLADWPAVVQQVRTALDRQRAGSQAG